MTTETNDTFAQFNAFIDSNVADEYKDILKNFQEQGLFYKQFIQALNDKQSDLSEFWDLPNTLGFSPPSNNQPEWLHSTFDINSSSQNTDKSAFDKFSQVLDPLAKKIQGNVSAIQSALSRLEALYSNLNQSAVKRFELLNESIENPSNEQLCAHWLKAGEDAFAEVSLTDDYIDTQKILFESLNELKNTQQTLSDQTTTLFGLPSKQSLEDLQKGLHKLRIEFAEYKEQTDVKLTELTQTINKLK